ncbi:glyoxalase-like domain protein [SAR86 cluster bacterium SAR86E]|uniref:Glyoxalase-like domain protein n=1 Tax=SAR86 cluster bacterium SAR86E TaxID=1208365 RepID=K6GJC3_9GAMM|nr:glyoxalase-like domain protein [SAR86 cluster bacterium SAR86E]
MKNPFHLAIPVNNLIKAAHFYENILGCVRGRSSDSWVDFNLFGHQVVCHEVKAQDNIKMKPVDGDDIPVPHFGVILNFDEFDELVEKLQKSSYKFFIEPKIRFAGKKGEQRIMFLKDPSGNALEFKAFKSLDQLFES